jgi:hypothetical protein
MVAIIVWTHVGALHFALLLKRPYCIQLLAMASAPKQSKVPEARASAIGVFSKVPEARASAIGVFYAPADAIECTRVKKKTAVTALIATSPADAAPTDTVKTASGKDPRVYILITNGTTSYQWWCRSASVELTTRKLHTVLAAMTAVLPTHEAVEAAAHGAGLKLKSSAIHAICMVLASAQYHFTEFALKHKERRFRFVDAGTDPSTGDGSISVVFDCGDCLKRVTGQCATVSKDAKYRSNINGVAPEVLLRMGLPRPLAYHVCLFVTRTPVNAIEDLARVEGMTEEHLQQLVRAFTATGDLDTDREYI